jgi:hypothetical protein
LLSDIRHYYGDIKISAVQPWTMGWRRSAGREAGGGDEDNSPGDSHFDMREIYLDLIQSKGGAFHEKCEFYHTDKREKG